MGLVPTSIIVGIKASKMLDPRLPRLSFAGLNRAVMSSFPGLCLLVSPPSGCFRDSWERRSGPVYWTSAELQLRVVADPTASRMLLLYADRSHGYFLLATVEITSGSLVKDLPALERHAERAYSLPLPARSAGIVNFRPPHQASQALPVRPSQVLNRTRCPRIYIVAYRDPRKGIEAGGLETRISVARLTHSMLSGSYIVQAPTTLLADTISRCSACNKHRRHGSRYHGPPEDLTCPPSADIDPF
ncbi:hypothetical protein V8F06_000569 [Rhypophila decipiens]